MRQRVAVAQTPPPIARHAAWTHPPPPATPHIGTQLGSKESPTTRHSQLESWSESEKNEVMSNEGTCFGEITEMKKIS